MTYIPAERRNQLSQQHGPMKAWARCFLCDWAERFTFESYARRAAHDHADIHQSHPEGENT